MGKYGSSKKMGCCKATCLILIILTVIVVGALSVALLYVPKPEKYVEQFGKLENCAVSVADGESSSLSTEAIEIVKSITAFYTGKETVDMSDGLGGLFQYIVEIKDSAPASAWFVGEGYASAADEEEEGFVEEEGSEDGDSEKSQEDIAAMAEQPAHAVIMFTDSIKTAFSIAFKWLTSETGTAASGEGYFVFARGNAVVFGNIQGFMTAYGKAFI